MLDQEETHVLTEEDLVALWRFRHFRPRFIITTTTVAEIDGRPHGFVSLPDVQWSAGGTREQMRRGGLITRRRARALARSRRNQPPSVSRAIRDSREDPS